MNPYSLRFIITFCLAFLVFQQVNTLAPVKAQTEREWTFMVYLDADNDLESAGIKDFNEMEKVGSSDKLAIIVQMDRIAGYDSSNGNWTETRRYYVIADNDTLIMHSNLLENMNELNMGDKGTLFSFINWTVQNYPAQHYALILWDHGGSSRTGPSACWDYTDNEDCLDMLEIKEALADAYEIFGKKIDILAFDACLMGTIEVAYQLRDYVSYMVASEETEPNDGYPYDMILTELAASPSMPPAQLASTIVTKYVISYTDALPDPEDAPHVTSAALNLTQVGNAATAVSALAEAVIADFSNSKSAVREAWVQAETFSGDFVDLYNFTRLLENKVSNTTIKTKAELVLDAVASLIISEGHGTAHLNAHGISIYYPKKYEKSSYVGLDFASDTLWDEFLDLATNINAEITPVCPSYTTGENITFMDVAVGDVDGDQETEIVAVGNYSDLEGYVYFVIAVFDITENGLVQLCNSTFSVGDYEELLSVTIADIDNDEIEEIIVCGGYYNSIEVTWYSYIGIFTVEENALVLQAFDEGADIFVESLDVADVDGDYFPEIIVSGHILYEDSFYAYIAVGNNSAVNSIDLERSLYWDVGYDENLNAVAVGDTDGDGLAEIVVGGEYYDYGFGAWTAYLAVLNCSQNSLVLQAYNSGANLWINSVDVADVDGDGFNEIVSSGYCLDYYGNIYMFIMIASNVPSNIIRQLTFEYWIVSGNSFICSIDVSDIEGDGIAEIIEVGYYYDMQSYTWKSCSIVLSWSQDTGLIVENIYEGGNQTYTYSVVAGNVDEDSQTEIVTCSEVESGSSMARIDVLKASNNVVTTGALQGVVTDGENPMPNAVVNVSIPRLSIVASVNTFANGSYVIENLPEGCYTIDVCAEGKVNLTRNGVIVKAGQTTELNFALIENVISTVSHSVNVEGQTFQVITVSNSTISNFMFNKTEKSIYFSVSAATGSTGFCNVTILKALLGTPYIIKIDGMVTEYSASYNETHVRISIYYAHSTHTIQIIGSSVIPEFSVSLLLLFSICILTVITFWIKRTTKNTF